MLKSFVIRSPQHRSSGRPFAEPRALSHTCPTDWVCWRIASMFSAVRWSRAESLEVTGERSRQSDGGASSSGPHHSAPDLEGHSRWHRARGGDSVLLPAGSPRRAWRTSGVTTSVRVSFIKVATATSQICMPGISGFMTTRIARLSAGRFRICVGAGFQATRCCGKHPCCRNRTARILRNYFST